MLIGLSGKAGSGKTTVTNYLTTMGFGTRKFAGPLKSMLADLLISQGVKPEDTHLFIEGALKEVPTELLGGKSPRHAMQTLGTEWGRGQLHEDFWVEAALRDLDTSDLIFDDVRFPNEARAIRNRGGIVVNVLREDAPQVGRHLSEDALMDFAFNFIIYNDADLDTLYSRVDTFCDWAAEYENGSEGTLKETPDA
jgi:hypothetical protein